MKLLPIVLLLSSLPLAAFAGDKKGVTSESIDTALMCQMTPKDFFAPLVADGAIVTKPVSVKGSISYFRPHMFKKITAHNMRVTSVFGYVADQIMFANGGVENPREFYGIVVDESIANVQAELSALGSVAKTRLVDHRTTAIICPGA